MNLLKCILTNNLCYKAGKTIKPKGVMVHSTGANNPRLKRYVQPLDKDDPNAYTPDRKTLLTLLGTNTNKNDWNHTERKVGVHAFVGKLADGSVACVQTLPWNHRAWHAGAGTSGKSANDTHISFEICEDSLTDQTYFEQSKQEAIELTAMLCMQYNLDPLADGVVICHQDGYKRGIANNHGDVYNWWNKYKYTMDMFRKAVNDKIIELKTPKPISTVEEDDDMIYYETRADVPDYYAEAIDKAIAAGALKGKAEGILNVSEDLCRILTILDRMGKL